MEEKKRLESLNSNTLIRILSGEYCYFGEDDKIKNKYLEYSNSIIEKRKEILKILLDRIN